MSGLGEKRLTQEAGHADWHCQDGCTLQTSRWVGDAAVVADGRLLVR